MVINEFMKDNFSLGNIQFAVGIALSQLGESVASKAVIEFQGTYVKQYSQSMYMAIIAERTRVETLLKKEKCGMLRAFLNYICENDVLVNESVGAYRIKDLYNLKSLLKHTTIDRIYKQTMLLLSRHSVLQLICVYMQTKEYYDIFALDLSRKYLRSADGVRNNDLSSMIVKEVLHDFREWIATHSANGAYSPSTGAPIAYLRHAFTNMYSVDDSQSLYKILNLRGINSEIADDGSTRLSFNGLDSVEQIEEIDFVEIANKINRASKLIFTHNSDSVAFYDIFSCYRDNLVEKKLEECKKGLTKKFQGCNFKIKGSNSINFWFDGAVKNKKAKRIGLCKIFEPIVTEGLAQSQIIEYYNKAIEYTEEITRKDGARLFTTKSHTTKHTESNSEMMQIIISGYLALRDLVLYLESREDVSVFSLPTIIFSDPAAS